MRTPLIWATGAAALLASFAAFGGVQDNVLLHHNFDADNNGWNVESSNAATAEVTKTVGDFKTGGGALKVKYTLEKGQFSALTLTTESDKWAKAKQLDFWLKTDHSTPFLLAAYEKDGGHYYATFWSPKNVWQHITLAPSDFGLATDANDPKDPNNRFDIDKVEKVLIADLANMLIQAENPNNDFLKVEGGLRTFWVDEFDVRSDTPATPKPAEEKAILIDFFQRDYLNWLPLGSAMPTIQIDKSNKPLEGRALKMDYSQEQGKPAVIMRGVTKSLAGSKSLAFDIASTQSTKILVMLEEKGGGRYNAMFDIEGDKKAQKKTVDFSEFKLADDSPPDTNGKLDLDNIKTIGFVDTAFFSAPEKKPNTLWFANLRAIP